MEQNKILNQDGLGQGVVGVRAWAGPVDPRGGLAPADAFASAEPALTWIAECCAPLCLTPAPWD